MKKQMKATVANQKLRLEQALSVERKWKAEDWRALFVKNPVMHQFAIGLIWEFTARRGWSRPSATWRTAPSILRMRMRWSCRKTV